MTIYLDFDGTVVEHVFPGMGRCNFGCFEVIKKLQDAGHEIILNTYRADIGKPELDAAMRIVNEFNWLFVKERSLRDDFALKPIDAAEKKIYPPMFDMKQAIKDEVLFIDDQATGTPLKRACMSNGMMVDWDVLDLLFQQYRLYEPVNTK